MAAPEGPTLPDVEIDATVNQPGDDDEVEPVEVLVQLAKDGEIEPWDIDIVEVTDAFLSRLDRSDLRMTGRALFYASVLLRMKSDALLESTADPEPEDEEPMPAPPQAAEFDWDTAPPGGDPIDALESEMQRRLDRKRARGTPETLEELIRELRSRERGKWWKKHRSYDTSDSPTGYDRGTQELDYRRGDSSRAATEPDEESVTGTTHREDIDASIEAVKAVLEPKYERGRSEVLFAEITDAAGSVVETYLAILFMSHRGVVRLHQEDYFEDLFIQNRTLVAE